MDASSSRFYILMHNLNGAWELDYAEAEARFNAGTNLRTCAMAALRGGEREDGGSG